MLQGPLLLLLLSLYFVGCCSLLLPRRSLQLALYPKIIDLDNSMNSDEQRRKALKPNLTNEELLESLRGLCFISNETGECQIIQQLDSYDDANYKVKIGNDFYLLKIHNGVESEDFLSNSKDSTIHFQCAMLCLLNERNINTYKHLGVEPIFAASGSETTLIARLLSWVEGQPMSQAPSLPIDSLASAGRFLGRLDLVLDEMNDSNFDGLPNPSWKEPGVLKAARRFHQWDGKHTPKLEPFLKFIKDDRRRQLVGSIVDAYKHNIIDSGAEKELRVGVIHADFNDANIIIDENLNAAGVIDFGDSVESYRVLDCTVGMAYSMLSVYANPNRRISAAAAFLRGYSAAYTLLPVERQHLTTLILSRLACSVTLGAYSIQQNPANEEYLSLHSAPAWKVLEMLWGNDPEQRQQILDKLDKIWDQAISCADNEVTVVPCQDLIMIDSDIIDMRAKAGEPNDSAETDQLSPTKKKQKTNTTDGDNADAEPIKITFVTGNKKKLEEVIRILNVDNTSHFTLDNAKLDLPEWQGKPVEIAKEKCKVAATKVGGIVLTEDTSLCFDALGDLPGPYIKWFLDSCGHDGLNRMLTGFDGNNKAYAQTIVALSLGPDADPMVFVGQTQGKIVPARGPTDFGWDPIFEPIEQDSDEKKTYAEMNKAEKDEISHRSRAFAQLRAFLQSEKGKTALQEAK